MAIKISVSPRVKFPIEGSFKNDEGADEPFKFSLLCKRLDAEEHRERAKADIDYIATMVELTEAWFDVKDDSGKPLEYSEDGLRALLKRPGLATLAYFTYVRESGAKAKN